MNDSKKLLLGGSSFFGQHLLKAFKPKNVVATYCENSFDGGVYFDAQTMDLSDVFSDLDNIAQALILIGETSFSVCFSDQEKAYQANVVNIKRILDFLKKRKIKPVFISSDYVFDGKKGMYRENDTPNPILIYGKHKYEIEQYLQAEFKDFLILRLAKIVGSDLNDDTLFTNWLEDIISGKAIKCAHDQIMSPVFIKDAVLTVRKSIEKSLSGIYHIAGEKAYSRIELFEMLLERAKKHFLCTPENFTQCSINELGLLEVYPLNISLNSSKVVEEAGVNFRDLESVCDEIVQKKRSMDDKAS